MTGRPGGSSVHKIRWLKPSRGAGGGVEAQAQGPPFLLGGRGQGGAAWPGRGHGREGFQGQAAASGACRGAGDKS